MRYLCFQREKRGPDAARYVSPVIKSKERRYGPVTDTETVQRRRPVLITGAHDSGKSRWLERLHAEAPGIWGKTAKAPPLWLGALRPLAAWVDAPHVGAWWDARPPEDRAGRNWAKLKPWERADALPDYLAASGAVLFIDDAHKLTGRKLEVARRCALASRIWCASCSEETRLSPSLRSVMLRCDPQMIRLTTGVSYDATNVFVWLLVLSLVASGAWELAAVAGGLRLLANGRRAARNE